MLRSAPNVPKFANIAPPYFELVAPRTVDAMSKHPTGTDIAFSSDGKEDGGDAPIITLSDSLASEFPLHTYEGWQIMRPDLFAKIERWFDFDFYLKERLDF
jgi:hypothetical protein